MNCQDCGTLEKVRDNSELALRYLHGESLSKQDEARAIACRECAAKKLSEDIKKRLK